MTYKNKISSLVQQLRAKVALLLLGTLLFTNCNKNDKANPAETGGDAKKVASKSSKKNKTTDEKKKDRKSKRDQTTPVKEEEEEDNNELLRLSYKVDEGTEEEVYIQDKEAEGPVTSENIWQLAGDNNKILDYAKPLIKAMEGLVFSEGADKIFEPAKKKIRSKGVLGIGVFGASYKNADNVWILGMIADAGNAKEKEQFEAISKDLEGAISTKKVKVTIQVKEEDKEIECGLDKGVIESAELLKAYVDKKIEEMGVGEEKPKSPGKLDSKTKRFQEVKTSPGIKKKQEDLNLLPATTPGK